MCRYGYGTYRGDDIVVHTVYYAYSGAAQSVACSNACYIDVIISARIAAMRYHTSISDLIVQSTIDSKRGLAIKWKLHCISHPFRNLCQNFVRRTREPFSRVLNRANSKMFHALLFILSLTLARCATVISKNPSFEQDISGGNQGPGGRFWNIRQPPGVTAASLQFLRDRAKARTGTGLLSLRLQAGAVFPSFVRVGQSVTLKNRYRYRVTLWVRVDAGTRIGGNVGAVVSTFCEAKNTGVFVGKDSTVDATPGFRKQDYTRIQFDVVGNGAVWDCTVALLGQPSAQPLPIRLSVDNFSVLEIRMLPNPGLTRANRLRDGGFNGPLAPLNYVNGQLVIPGNLWQADYFFSVATPPTLEGSGPAKKLALELPTKSSRQVLEFTGVVQKVTLRAGQQYELAVRYTRVDPQPTSLPFTLFNYYLRLPGTVGGLIRQTEGLLMGLVDVRVTSATGVTSVRFIAPRGGVWQIVLKVSAYGNERVTGPYRLTFDNARLTSIP